MGYNENQFSLPRKMDLSVSRQFMHDALYQKIPTQGWMLVPLVDYHSGGKAAAFEPLADHIDDYNWALAQYFGAGVACAYRGYRLYDTNETKAIVEKWVTFYKTYRDILISDVIHLRRADMQSIDSFMHVNPSIDNHALAMMFNPTNHTVSQWLNLPLYYTGLTGNARIKQEEAVFISYELKRDYSVDIMVKLPAGGITWFLIKA